MLETNDNAQPKTAPRTGDNRAWFEWALDLFWFFKEAPRPSQYARVDLWVVPFDTWADQNLSDTCKTVAGFILGFWNSSRRWKTRRDLHRALANADNGIRSGIGALIANARFF